MKEIQKKISERAPQSRRGTLFDGSTGHDNLKPDCLQFAFLPCAWDTATSILSAI